MDINLHLVFFITALLQLAGCRESNPHDNAQPVENITTSAEEQHKHKILKELQGKWYFKDAPLSYVEIKGDKWTEYGVELGVQTTQRVIFEHGELTGAIVLEEKSPIVVRKPGDRVTIQIMELREDLLRYKFTSPNGSVYCTVMVRQKISNALPSEPC